MKMHLLTACITMILPMVATAGDAWLVADSAAVNDGDFLWLSFVAGDVFPLGEAATDPARIAGFVDRHGGAVRDVAGYAPEDRGLSIRAPITGAGTHVIGCALRPRLIELAQGDVEARLRPHGAEHGAEAAMSGLDLLRSLGPMESGGLRPVSVQWTAADVHDRDGGPVLVRCWDFAKTVVEVEPSDVDDEGYAAVLDHPLEIVPLSHPCHWRAGSTVRVKVLLDGHPWPGLPVAAGHEGLEARGYVQRTTTDAHGVASIRLTRAGHWFVKADLIRPASGLGKVQWEGFQSSLTFRALGKTNVNGALRAIRAIHGELDPWAVVGYRMGRRALEELDLRSGSADLLAVHKTPLRPQYTFIADGIQAATGASTGRLNLRLEQAGADDLQTLFTNQATGGSVVIRLRGDFVRTITGIPRDAQKASALKAVVLSDEEMFVVLSASEVPPSPDTFDEPIGVARLDR